LNESNSSKQFKSGAKSSDSKPPYWLIPREVITAIALRFQFGATKYTIHNWKKGGEDPQYIRDRFNHMYEHMLKFVEGGDAEDNRLDSIVAVLINAVFITYWTIRHPEAVDKAFYTDPRDENLN
jgi:hypothetical protein